MPTPKGSTQKRSPPSLTLWEHPGNIVKDSQYSFREWKDDKNGKVHSTAFHPTYQQWCELERDRINQKGGNVKIGDWDGKIALEDLNPPLSEKEIAHMKYEISKKKQLIVPERMKTSEEIIQEAMRKG